MIKAVIFDFDGVIVKDSEYVKRDAWRDVFPELGDRVFEVIDPLIGKYFGGKGSRFDIIRDVCILELNIRDELEEKIKYYIDRYNEFVQKRITALGVDPLDVVTLKELSDKIPLFLNSATPEDAIKQTTKKLNIECFFKGIFGYNKKPTSKVDNLKRAMKVEGIMPDELLFVGDSNEDYQASTEVGVNFVGVSNRFNGWKEKKFKMILSIGEIPDFLKKES